MNATLREELDAGKSLLGTFSALNSPQAIEIFGRASYDFIVIDCQHGPTSPYGMDLVNQVRAAENSGLHAIVRVTSLDSGEILKALDAGAEGIIVPQIGNAEDARQIVKAARFATEGHRSSCPGARIALRANKDWLDYKESANSRCLVLPLIEDVQGFNNLDEIVAIEGIDGIFFGPFDLAVDLGKDADPYDAVSNYRDVVYTKARENGTVVGDLPWNVKSAKKFAAQGAQLLAIGMDVSLLAAATDGIRKEWLSSPVES